MKNNYMKVESSIKKSKMEIEAAFVNPNAPLVKVGDTLKLGISITEGNRKRIQFTEGVVISTKNSGLTKTYTLRHMVQGIGVERVYLLHSPSLKSIEVLKAPNVRKSKLYYLRLRFGRDAKLQQTYA